MYSYIIGEVTEVESAFITIENSGIGYKISVSNPYTFKIGEHMKVYLYQHLREDESSLYGFRDIESKELFLKLISVKGLGCKMGMPILATDAPNDIVSAIEREDVTYLKKFPKIGDKVARQIILDLKGKLVKSDDVSNKHELIETLKALGYKSGNIDKIVKEIDQNQSLEEQVKKALQMLLK